MLQQSFNLIPITKSQVTAYMAVC